MLLAMSQGGLERLLPNQRASSYQTLHQKGEQQARYAIQFMGMGYIDHAGKPHVEGSDRPDEHIQESYEFRDLALEYLASPEGKEFIRYAKERNPNGWQNVIGFGSADLGDRAVAAFVSDGKRGRIVGNYDRGRYFSERIDEFSAQHGDMPREWGLEYALVHEFVHAVLEERTEEGCEARVAEHFDEQYQKAPQGSQQREKYQVLRTEAKKREQQARAAGV